MPPAKVVSAPNTTITKIVIRMSLGGVKRDGIVSYLLASVMLV